MPLLFDVNLHIMVHLLCGKLQVYDVHLLQWTFTYDVKYFVAEFLRLYKVVFTKVSKMVILAELYVFRIKIF